ncbi:TPA: transposase [Staphylococcus delphini]|nr:transposase [Staphylococcus delphini]
MNKDILFASIITQLSLDVSESTLSLNYKRYLKHGLKSLDSRRKGNPYSTEFEMSLVNEYFHTGKSFITLAAEYDIPSKETIRRWVIGYTEGKEAGHNR